MEKRFSPVKLTIKIKMFLVHIFVFLKKNAFVGKRFWAWDFKFSPQPFDVTMIIDYICPRLLNEFQIILGILDLAHSLSLEYSNNSIVWTKSQTIDFASSISEVSFIYLYLTIPLFNTYFLTIWELFYLLILTVQLYQYLLFNSINTYCSNILKLFYSSNIYR